MIQSGVGGICSNGNVCYLYGREMVVRRGLRSNGPPIKGNYISMEPLTTNKDEILIRDAVGSLGPCDGMMWMGAKCHIFPHKVIVLRLQASRWLNLFWVLVRNIC